MHKPLSLRKNFSWTLIGNIIYFASQFGILIILAKLGTTQMVGRFSLGLAIRAPVMIFANMALRPVQATDAKREYLFCDYLGLRLITTFLALLVIATISFIGGYGKETSLVILIVGIAKAFEAISDVYYGPLQQHERMDRIAKSLMIKGPLALIIVGRTDLSGFLWVLPLVVLVIAYFGILFILGFEQEDKLILRSARDKLWRRGR